MRSCPLLLGPSGSASTAGCWTPDPRIADSILFQFPVERGLADPQYSGSHDFVAVQALQRVQNGLLLHFGQRQDSVCFQGDNVNGGGGTGDRSFQGQMLGFQDGS